MANEESKTNENSNQTSTILSSDDLHLLHGVSRRDFMKFSASGVAFACVGGTLSSCGGSHSITPVPVPPTPTKVVTYPISSTVLKTSARTLSFPMPPIPSGPNSGTGLYPTELPKISEYSKYGYGNYTMGGKLDVVPRYLTTSYSNPSPVRVKKLANFFAMSDVHITDKESPNQLIYLQQTDTTMGMGNTSIYSPVMLYTTHVLDAAIQTVNALHKQSPFDFGICLGDVCNTSQYNELRWFLDVMDGQPITPSSGAHLGADKIDFQKPYQSAGIDPTLSWYQVLGNHDHFLIGSVAIDAIPSLGVRDSYTAGNIWAAGDVLTPHPKNFPAMVDWATAIAERTYYMGTIDGTSPTGAIKGAAVAAGGAAMTVTPDPDRRALHRAEWIQEFFNTKSLPTGHGMNLIDPSMGPGFACYSFLPNPDIPLKMIVLDDTQSETDGSHDIHGHAFLDATRWNWLQAELAAGQVANQLMIIAAHVPIGVANIGAELEWWESEKDPNAVEQNACTLAELVSVLWNTPNLLMWMAGHRHLNTVKAFVPPPNGNPEQGFWQVETSSLRDHPQQFRTFEIYLNDDYSVSIITTNVDPAVADGTPAATSRTYAIATQQIVQTNLLSNAKNLASIGNLSLESMDPSRPQNGTPDGTIVYGSVADVPYCASYNAELFKQLSPAMVAALKEQFPVK